MAMLLAQPPISPAIKVSMARLIGVKQNLEAKNANGGEGAAALPRPVVALGLAAPLSEVLPASAGILTRSSSSCFPMLRGASTKR